MTRPRDRLASLGNPAGLAFTPVGLGLLMWGLVETAHFGTSGRHLVALVLAGLAGAAWLVEVLSPLGSRRALRVACLLVMGIAGGVLASLASLAIVFMALAAFLAALWLPVRHATALACTGPLALAVSGVVEGGRWGVMVNGLAATATGLVVGLGRQQAVRRTEEEAAAVLASSRAEVDAARAEMLSERNRLAREIHDVLAHTLSALSIQIEALSGLAADRRLGEHRLLDGLGTLRTLVHEGLREAREAVTALRDDADPLELQLERLCDARHVTLEVDGAARTIAPEAALSLYRIAQEALTNAAKHAPNAGVTVRLTFCHSAVCLSVDNGLGNGAAVAELAASGGGFGLQGMRERVALLGGRLDAGAVEGGWKLEAEVPA